MFTKEEKEIIVTILTNFLMNNKATHEEFQTIKKIIDKLTSES